MNELEQAEIFSRKIQELKNTEYYKIFKTKLDSDAKKYLNMLIQKDDPDARGAIKYIQSLLGWFDMEAQKEELISIQKDLATEDY